MIAYQHLKIELTNKRDLIKIIFYFIKKSKVLRERRNPIWKQKETACG